MREPPEAPLKRMRTGVYIRGRHPGVEERGGEESLAHYGRKPVPKNGFWTPLRLMRFPPPSRRHCPVFPVQKSKTQHSRSSFGGSEKY